MSKEFKPFVPADQELKEFTIRGLIIGLFLAVILGAANAYLGLKAGMTIAATYPAAVIGMAVLRLFRKSNVLEENFVRTVGSIGESVAAGAIFTLPAFYIAGFWVPFYTFGNYLTASLILLIGGVLGIMFVALLRRIMVEDTELPYPESVAAAEIHKTGSNGSGGSKFLFSAMLGGAVIKALGEFKFFAEKWEHFKTFASQLIPGTAFKAKGGILLSSPGISPAYVGVGYIIGPKLGALNFSGGLIAWGLLTPLIMYFISPYFDATFLQAWAAMIADTTKVSMEKALSQASDPIFQMNAIWRYIVRPIAIGGMLMGAGFTLFRMRKSLITGLARSFSDVKKAATSSQAVVIRTEKDLSFSTILLFLLACAAGIFCITYFVFKTDLLPALVAATVLVVLAFFLAAISGYLVGIMGSSNNPISGLTLTGLLLTALTMVAMGVDAQHGGVTAVLGAAAIVCVAAAVAGEMLQDLKAGHILGGTPWKMETGNLIGVLISAAVMFLVLDYLNQSDIAEGAKAGYVGGFGSSKLAAPQAGLMAMLAKGIVGGEMAWPLIIVGMLMGLGMILMQVRSPMLVSVGMYLPLETTFAIFIGGLVKGVVEIFAKKRQYNEFQMSRVENVGILLAAGFIAGEALTGLGFAPFKILEMDIYEFSKDPSFLLSCVVMVLIAVALIWIPLRNAGRPDEPAGPSISM